MIFQELTHQDSPKKTFNKMELYPYLEFIQIMRKKHVQEFFSRRERGCSDSYKLLLKKHLRDEKIKPPQAPFSASASYNFPFNQQKWQNSLKNFSNRIALPHSSTMILKIFYRQNWTPSKQGKRTHDPEDQYCKYCPSQRIDS